MNKSFMVDSPIGLLLFPKHKDPKKRFHSLNLNVYRNMHWSKLGPAKKLYGDIMIPALMRSDSHLERFEQINIEYQIIACNNRAFDTMNIISVVDKYFQDVLSHAGIIKDDNWKIVKKITVLPVIVDKELPETICRIRVIEV